MCGESLPPDHFYCREHSAGVDDRLHEIAALLRRVAADVPRLAELLDQVAQETWDYLAEGQTGSATPEDDPDWPPALTFALRAHPDDVDVDVDSEPGQVRVNLTVRLPALMAALETALRRPDLRMLADAAGAAEGANATH